jgi:hypothetical protein
MGLGQFSGALRWYVPKCLGGQADSTGQLRSADMLGTAA